MRKTLLFTLLASLFSISSYCQKRPKISYEEIKEICTDIPLNKRLRVSVSSFKSATPAASTEFGDELAQMLTNALQNVNCYNVLLSQKDLKEISDEIELGQSGNVKKGKAPKSGQMLGAQVIVMGKVTEFEKGEDNINAIGLKVASGKAKLGFIISLINAETREIVASKSINVQGSAGGFKGFKIFNTEVIGSTSSNKGNKAVADAMEKGIIDAIEFITNSKDNLPFPEIQETTKTKAYTNKNCRMLKTNKTPKIIVIIPEFNYVKPQTDISINTSNTSNTKKTNNSEHSSTLLKGKSNNNENEEKNYNSNTDASYKYNTKPLRYSIGESSSENELIKNLSNTGFQIIDNSLYISDDLQYANASKNSKNAIEIAKKANADICIYGNVSIETSTIDKNKKSSSAVLEIKAINVKDGILLASNSFEGKNIDISEISAAKKAAIEASQSATEFILEKFCESQTSF